MSNDDNLTHLSRMVFGSIEDLKISLQGMTTAAEIEEALVHARQLREGKTKIAMLERRLRQLQKESA